MRTKTKYSNALKGTDSNVQPTPDSAHKSLRQKVILCKITRDFSDFDFTFSCHTFSPSLYYIKEYCQSNPAVREAFDIHIATYSDRRRAGTIVRDLLKHKPAIVGFCCYITEHQKTTEVARLMKAEHPEIFVVFGGPDAVSSEYAQEDFSFVDAAVHLDGEMPFEDLLLSRIQGRKLDTVRGITFRRKGTTIFTGFREDSVDLSAIPSFYTKAFVETFSGPILYQTSRGCRFKCSFCTTTRIAYRELPLDRVKHELSLILNSPNITYVLLTDFDLALNVRRFDKILDFLIQENTRRIPIYGFWTTTRKMQGLIGKMKQAGFSHNFPVSLQSGDPAALKACGRKWLTLQHLESLAPEILRHFPEAHVDLILGLPEETVPSFKQTLFDLFKLGFRKFNVFDLIVSPGAALYDLRHDLKLECHKDMRIRRTPNLSEQDIACLKQYSRNFQILAWLFEPADIPLLDDLGIGLGKLAGEIGELPGFCQAGSNHSIHITDVNPETIHTLTEFLENNRIINSDTARRLNDFLRLKVQMLQYEIAERNPAPPAAKSTTPSPLRTYLELKAPADILGWLHIKQEILHAQEGDIRIFVLFNEKRNRAIPTVSQNPELYCKLLQVLTRNDEPRVSVFSHFDKQQRPRVSMMIRQLRDSGFLVLQ